MLYSGKVSFGKSQGGRRGEETSYVKDLAVRHSGAGQPSVRSGKRLVATGIKNMNSSSNCSNRWGNGGFANSLDMILKDWKAFSLVAF